MTDTTPDFLNLLLDVTLLFSTIYFFCAFAAWVSALPEYTLTSSAPTDTYTDAIAWLNDYLKAERYIKAADALNALPDKRTVPEHPTHYVQMLDSEHWIS